MTLTNDMFCLMQKYTNQSDLHGKGARLPGRQFAFACLFFIEMKKLAYFIHYINIHWAQYPNW